MAFGAADLAVFLALALAGVLMSLHCIGMCGPILAGFSQMFDRGRSSTGQVTLTVEGATLQRAPSVGGRIAARTLDFAWYHLGRLWTYGMLGIGAGALGAGLRETSALAGAQRLAGWLLAIGVILGGVMLLGLARAPRLRALVDGCAVGRLGGHPFFQALVHGRGAGPRLLLGAIMGLLPCGLVYAMLVLVATLPTPIHAGLGMIAFGIGTLPGLTGVLALGELVPAKVRAWGNPLAGALLIVVGLFMAYRAGLEPDDCCGSHRMNLPAMLADAFAAQAQASPSAAAAATSPTAPVDPAATLATPSPEPTIPAAPAPEAGTLD